MATSGDRDDSSYDLEGFDDSSTAQGDSKMEKRLATDQDKQPLASKVVITCTGVRYKLSTYFPVAPISV